MSMERLAEINEALRAFTKASIAAQDAAEALLQFSAEAGTAERHECWSRQPSPCSHKLGFSITDPACTGCANRKDQA